MTVKGGAAPACAACKFQRRRCTPTCLLAPYFPANQPQLFRNVHRLFGVANITKVLKELKTKDQKEDAMKSIIYEADMRERFPVYGCSVVICQLWYQYQVALEELRSVYAQLSALKEQSSSGVDNSGTSVVIQRQSVGNEMNQFLLNENSGGFYGDPTTTDCMMRPPPVISGLESCSESTLTAIQSQMDALSILQQDRSVFLNDFEGASFNMRIEDRHSYIDNREAFESSTECSSENSAKILQEEQIPEKELKTAAACFSLTTLN